MLLPPRKAAAPILEEWTSRLYREGADPLEGEDWRTTALRRFHRGHDPRDGMSRCRCCRRRGPVSKSAAFI